MLKICLQITFFAFLNLFNGIRHINVIRRQHTRLSLDAQLLDFRRIKTEILSTQRPHSNQFHLAFQDIQEHRQFI